MNRTSIKIKICQFYHPELFQKESGFLITNALHHNIELVSNLGFLTNKNLLAIRQHLKEMLIREQRCTFQIKKNSAIAEYIIETGHKGNFITIKPTNKNADLREYTKILLDLCADFAIYEVTTKQL